MKKVILQMRMSLDGYATGPSGEIDWAPFRDERALEDQWKEWWKLWESVDTVLLGRKTYQAWEKRWPALATNPASGPNNVRFSRFVEGVRKVVFSRTLKSADWTNSTLIRGDIGAEVLRLKQEPGGNILVAGGPTLAMAAMDSHTVDEVLLTVDPVVACGGSPLFSKVPDRIRLTLNGVKAFASGSVQLHYIAGPLAEDTQS